MHKMKISRRNFLAATASAAAVPIANCARADDQKSKSSARPNIIFIMADDLGYADVSCYGRRDYETPHIDTLARDGVKYLHGYANSPVCSATRTALITGRYQYRLPVGLEEPLVGTEIGLPPEQVTLPSILQEHGYETALIGKWHLGQLPKFGPLKSGYDKFWGFRTGAVDYFTHEGAFGPDLWDGGVAIEESGYITELMGARAVEAIAQYADQPAPFFLSVHFTAPHWPWIGPDDEAESERLRAQGDSFSLLHFDGGTLETYGKIVRSMDDQVGRILAALEQHGLSENTIVVFTSDNGGERFSDTWPFSGRKLELLEGGLRVPCLVRWPERIPAGRESDDMVMSMDWAPTLLAACDVPVTDPTMFDGVDVFRAFDTGAMEERTLFWRYKFMSQEACRSGSWKYLKMGDNEFLFNVVQDPLERANLKALHPERFEQLKLAFDRWNETMLPIDPNSLTGGLTGAQIADRYGVAAPVGIPDE